MPFTLPPLPYADDALAPHISAQTLHFHHGKHHKAYVDKANELITGTPLAQLSAVEVIRRARADGNDKLFNNAAQAWNHEFLWQSMMPGGGGAPSGALKAAIDTDLGGMEKFAENFKTAAVGQFGSGWAWLVRDGGALKIVTTHDADTPIAHTRQTPLLTLDVWEHAYYLDWQNARPDYVGAFLGELVNWDFASANFADETRLAA
ncbi:superoxide dismutase [Glacieibacterium frigidum]|uniref:Superoxide dismutase n=1 Tax=Glacieibacterium frigidum TaxID=2593303 RepID=A0A552U9U2_9SPHN|nr:superoxide dismutase [Glacieibacterium frigidum]TRW14980.1 superoxide dismutase [Glacieibacterium frigidum]